MLQYQDVNKCNLYQEIKLPDVIIIHLSALLIKANLLSVDLTHVYINCFQFPDTSI